MGSDALGVYTRPGRVTLKSMLVVLATYLVLPFAKVIIAKSENIKRKVYRKKATIVIPNGLDMKLFQPESDHKKVREELGLSLSGNYVLFINNPEHEWKNIALAREAFEMAGIKNCSLLTPYPVSQETVAKYYNAADVLLVTSLMEGSSNVIKEAMACNCPIVATNVGDAAWVTKGISGCFITTFEPQDMAEKIRLAIQYSNEKGRTSGRQRILDLGLESDTVAKKLVRVYEKVIKARHYPPTNHSTVQ
jgi:glycosyltransferase involved in cell wall biosynthesis